MATEERLPPTCAFAISVLAEYGLDPDAVPEEAVEAAQLHVATCPRCARPANNSMADTAPRKKKKVRRVPDPSTDPLGLPGWTQQEEQTALAAIPPQTSNATPERPAAQVMTIAEERAPAVMTILTDESALQDGLVDCQQCRQLLPEYAEALDTNQNVTALYPEIQAHLLTCESGCLVLLDFFRQEAKATRKYRRRPVRNPFGVIGWELTGFFRGGQVPISPKALAYGTLMLLLVIASLSTYIGVTLNEARHKVPAVHLIPTPDGIGLSDGLKIFDACNNTSYQYKRDAAQAMHSNNASKADGLLTSALSSVQTDDTGCNGAEAAIYRENARVRQSERAYGVMVVSFDSGPGNADPQGGTDRHILYAPYTQELIGAYIGQQQYNQTQMKTPGAPLLYLVLANTTGVETGALQVANMVADLAKATDYQQFGLLASAAHPLLGVLGLGPSSLLQIALPVMCRAGIPLIAPTATSLFIVDQISQSSLYSHCTPGFSFVRFSADEEEQSTLSANYAYEQLKAHNVAVFFDPSNPSSKGSANGFINHFSGKDNVRIIARETIIDSGLQGANARPQASQDDLLAALQDALAVKPRPDLIYAPLLTNDVTALGQAIAHLPADQQLPLIIDGEIVRPAVLQGLEQWGKQNQLTLPPMYIGQSAAVRSQNDGDWQKQFYSSFCTSFAKPGSFCSGATALDQGALLFGDGIELVTKSVGPITDVSQFPSRPDLVQHMLAEQFTGVSTPITLRTLENNMLVSTKSVPVMLSIQQDGTIQIVG